MQALIYNQVSSRTNAQPADAGPIAYHPKLRTYPMGPASTPYRLVRDDIRFVSFPCVLRTISVLVSLSLVPVKYRDVRVGGQALVQTSK